MRFLSKQFQADILNQVSSEEDPMLYYPPMSSLPENIPSTWRGLLASEQPRESIFTLVWAPLAAKLPRTTAAMKKSLQGICLLTTKAVPARLLYCFGYGDYTFVLCGGVPRKIQRPEAALLPQYFLDFYSVHDGWALFYHPESGPLPSADWFRLSDLEDRDFVEKMRQYINPREFLVVAQFAADGYLGFDLATAPARSYICWKAFPIEIVPDVWRKFDDELGEFLEQVDPV